MKFASFDIEIQTEIPDGVKDWDPLMPLGISCAALLLEGEKEPRFWKGVPGLDKQECIQMVRELQQVVQDGYTLLTWNGCHFDFKDLSKETEMQRECAGLSLNHVDMMLLFTFKQGYFLGLEKALQGAGLGGKLKNVTLNNGDVIQDMSGVRAPALWKRGEYQAVLAYLRDDVVQQLKLARNIQETNKIRWTSRSGTPQQVFIERLWNVRDCFKIPEPDTSWMTDPPRREEFIDWFPDDMKAQLL